MAKKAKKAKSGRKEDRLKIESQNWEEAIGKALKKKRPQQGWPSNAKPKRMKKKAK
jgi:hypothetical protein